MSNLAMTALFLLGTAFSAQALDLETQVDALLRNYQGSVPGASVGIYQNGRILLAKGYGLARLPDQIVTTNSNFRLASLTKQFTAMAINLCEHRGLLSFEDSLTKYFPDFPAYGERIRVKHLLYHTSGLIDYETLIPPTQTEQVHDQDVLDLLTKQTSTYFTPGTQYRYSNGGYALLALIVQKASGLDFASFLKQEIFLPLSMHETVAFEDGIAEVNHRAYGHTARGNGWDETDQSATSAVLGDGGVYTSASEYFLWDQALYGDAIAPQRIIQRAFLPGHLDNGTQLEYGMGWMLSQYRGKRVMRHTGGTIGFRSVVDRYTDDHMTIFLIMNRESANPWDIAKRIADLVLFAQNS